MKPLRLCCCALFISLLAFSCSPTRLYDLEEKKVRFPDTPIFVTKSDGVKLTGRSISTPGSFAFSHDWIKLDGQKFLMGELQNYQDQHAFHIKYNSVWARQLKRGKINLYWYITSVPEQRMMSTGRYATVYKNIAHFLFQKDDGPILELSGKQISELLSDNREAQAKFDATFKPGRKWFPQHLADHPKTLFAILDMYNNS
jgi:hypothetical protein